MIKLLKYATRPDIIRHIPKLANEWAGNLPQLLSAWNRPDVDIYGFGMQMLPKWYQMTQTESMLWAKFYLPLSVKGMTILDVGAGCGETAAFYLSHGAKGVVAIEPNPFAFTLLQVNAKKLGGRIKPIFDFFKISQLSIKHDFLKMDAEGAENELLKYNGELGPCVIEAHENKFVGIAENLAKRFGLREIVRTNNFTRILSHS